MNNQENTEEEFLHNAQDVAQSTQDGIAEGVQQGVNDAPKEEGDQSAEAENPAEEPQKTKEEELEEALLEMKDKYLRQVAEFDNYRKRTIKEKADLILNGSERAVQAFLPIMDDMARARENMAKASDVEALKEGMELIFQKAEKMLASLGVKPIETEDKDFNTDFHEAIAMVPGMGDDKKGKVIDCVQTGYTLNDKVIRHAKVAVGQ